MSILWGGASDSVHRQSGRCTRWRASCASLCCAQRQVPRVLFFQQGSGCCSTLTRSSMSWERGCSMEACERISHIFYVLLALFAWNLDRYFLEPLVLAAICPCALRQSTAALGRISSIFYVKSGLGSLLAVHTWKFGIISTSSIWQRTKPPVPASVYVAFGRISHIFIVLVVPASLRSSHLKIWTLFLLAVIWRWEVGFRRH